MIAGLVPPTPDKIIAFIETLLTSTTEFVLAIFRLAV